ncbi:3-hydroxyacyl-ACP dehydratase FabZ [Chitinispirillales bacterium ANBcel5]|uniref:3-hydroxyacyl-ACP dehydratase FabZ n=1 Tax=Cellulosispirillum alkaliphilum TaxID=3039283 RepID=UPI002A572A3B|nr:3-hydroxyacyl-ACP dehydratase FabZ [Chitinispirillales bacterium ANBcel5]
MSDYQDILTNVPHRYPFLLIDKIEQFEADTSVTTVKNVSFDEAQFSGHFPETPVFPGVYIIENMAQSACYMLTKSSGGADKNTIYYLGRVGKLSFLRPVYPGDCLVTSVKLEKKFGVSASVIAKSTVNGKTVAKGELMFGAKKSS